MPTDDDQIQTQDASSVSVQDPTTPSDGSGQTSGQATADASAGDGSQPSQPVVPASPAGDGGTPATSQPSADPTAGQLSAGRQNMLDLINKWMPTSLSQPMVPDGETQDLLSLAGWNKAMGQSSKTAKDNGQAFNTSCGDVLLALLKLWKSNFLGAFGIRDTGFIYDQGKVKSSPGAKALGYYVQADGVQSPKPGDILVLRNGIGSGSVGSVGHVGILVEAGTDVWRTADGGGGALPDQTARVTDRNVRFDNNNISILKSPTDSKEKQLDGWVDLDQLSQTGPGFGS